MALKKSDPTGRIDTVVDKYHYWYIKLEGNLTLLAEKMGKSRNYLRNVVNENGWKQELKADKLDLTEKNTLRRHELYNQRAKIVKRINNLSPDDKKYEEKMDLLTKTYERILKNERIVEKDAQELPISGTFEAGEITGTREDVKKALGKRIFDKLGIISQENTNESDSNETPQVSDTSDAISSEILVPDSGGTVG